MSSRRRPLRINWIYKWQFQKSGNHLRCTNGFSVECWFHNRISLLCQANFAYISFIRQTNHWNPIDKTRHTFFFSHSLQNCFRFTNFPANFSIWILMWIKTIKQWCTWCKNVTIHTRERNTRKLSFNRPSREMNFDVDESYEKENRSGRPIQWNFRHISNDKLRAATEKSQFLCSMIRFYCCCCKFSLFHYDHFHRTASLTFFPTHIFSVSQFWFFLFFETYSPMFSIDWTFIEKLNLNWF